MNGKRKILLALFLAAVCAVLLAIVASADDLIPVGTPQNVHWNEEIPGEMCAAMERPYQEKVVYTVYRVMEDGSESICGRYNWHTAKEEQKIDSPIVEDAFKVSGDYYFTVQERGDNKEYSDGEIVRSEVFHYEKPESALQTPTIIGWSWPTANWEPIDETEFLYGFLVQFLYSEDEDGEPSVVGASWGFASTHTNVYDSVFRNGDGYYYFEVKAYSKDITKIVNSAFARSDVYHYTSESVESVLDSIIQETNGGGLSPDEIRQSVQSMDYEDLRIAMLADHADENVVRQLKELEQATGTKLLVDTTFFDGNLMPIEDARSLEGIDVTGALLNPLTKDEVTLKISKPEKDVVLPELYNSTVSVAFSADLDGVSGTEALKVPVKITIPVPKTINPEFMRILHYPANGGDPEEIRPYTFADSDGNWFASFVLDHFSDFVITEIVVTVVRGDVNEDGTVNSNDAIHLLRHTMDGERFPITQSGDMNGDGKVDSNDAIYLLRHTMDETRFPLMNPGFDSK